MLTNTYAMLPKTSADADQVFAEADRSRVAYNMFMHHHIRWEHFRREVRCALPDEHDLAQKLRETPRTGRKPTPKVEVHCSGPKNPKARLQNTVIRIAQDEKLEGKLTELREKHWEQVEVTRLGLGRSDDEELKAHEIRKIYRWLRDAGTHYLTIDMASDSASQAIRAYMKANKGEIPDFYRVRKSDAELCGRVGVEASWLHWGSGPEGWNQLEIAGTNWGVHKRLLKRRPITAEQRELGLQKNQQDKYVDTTNARIRQVYISVRRRTGPYAKKARYRFMLHVVMDNCEHRMHRVDDNRTHAGIDICWRRDGETTRVAYAAFGDGTHRAYTLPTEVYSGMQHAESLQGIADQEIDKLRDMLGLHRMTSARKVLEAADTSDSPLFADMAKQARHVYAWHHGARRSMLAKRDQSYLQDQLVPLLQKCHTIYVEDLDGRGVSRLVAKKKDAVAGNQRQITSPLQSWLRPLQREAYKYGCTVVVVPSAFTSQQCPDCNTLIGPSSDRERTCPSCGVHHDMDHLAARNLISRGQELVAAARSKKTG